MTANFNYTDPYDHDGFFNDTPMDEADYLLPQRMLGADLVGDLPPMTGSPSSPPLLPDNVRPMDTIPRECELILTVQKQDQMLKDLRETLKHKERTILCLMAHIARLERDQQQQQKEEKGSDTSVWKGSPEESHDTPTPSYQNPG